MQNSHFAQAFPKGVGGTEVSGKPPGCLPNPSFYCLSQPGMPHGEPRHLCTCWPALLHSRFWACLSQGGATSARCPLSSFCPALALPSSQRACPVCSKTLHEMNQRHSSQLLLQHQRAVWSEAGSQPPGSLCFPGRLRGPTTSTQEQFCICRNAACTNRHVRSGWHRRYENRC